MLILQMAAAALGADKVKTDTFTKTFLKNIETGELIEHKPGAEISCNQAVVLKKYRRNGIHRTNVNPELLRKAGTKIGIKACEDSERLTDLAASDFGT